MYPELLQLARVIFSEQRPGHTLQPTALVNEAWLKLDGGLEAIEDRRHFFVVAGMAMRQILADHARGRLALKRGGGAHRVTFSTALSGQNDGAVDLFLLNESLEQLAELNERHARVATLRLFSGLTIDEVADETGMSPRAVDADWAMAKAWLRRRLA